MIRTIAGGQYQIIETWGYTRILILEGQTRNAYAWVNAKGIGEILITTHKEHHADYFIAIGKYRLYEVKDEPDLTDQIHLELFVGEGLWQGYLLPAGLPTDEKKRNRIIPTKEIITRTTH